MVEIASPAPRDRNDGLFKAGQVISETGIIVENTVIARNPALAGGRSNLYD